jgi:hypothetical protein
MHFRVVSASFNLYLTNSLTYEEVKVHCCENLLLNILTFLENLTRKKVGMQTGSIMSMTSAKNQVLI